MDLFQSFGNLLRADGTNQLQRTLPALERDYVLPDERDLARLLDYARGIAAELRFHNVGGQPTGNWAPMFEPLLEAATARVLPAPRLEELLASTSAWPPHLTLLLAFLRNFGHLQRDLNELPGRHLAFYYADFLEVVSKRASPDRVHVVFELARNAEPHRLEAGTLLDAGKDGLGRSLSYALERELIVTHARIADAYRLVAERDKYGRRRFFRSESLPEQGSWPTFGQSQFHLDQASRTMQEVDQGFALAAPLFRLAEGERRIVVTGTLQPSSTPPPGQNLSLYARVELTGEEGWFAPHDARLVLEHVAGELRLRLDVTVAEGQPAVTDFSEDLHAGGPAAPWPVMRCLIRSDSGRFDTLDGLVLAAAEIEVSVTGMQELIVQNDQDTLEAGKPISLFGSRPRIGSSFYIGSHEVFSKRLTELTLHLEWQDLPQDLLDHYIEYFDLVDVDLRALFRGSFEVEIDLLDGRSWNHRLVAPQDLFEVAEQRTIPLGEGAFTSSFGPGEIYEAAPHMAPSARYEAGTKRGFLRLKLSGPTQDDLTTSVGVPYAHEIPFKAFGHDAFGPRYAKQAMELARWNGVGTEPGLPNEPYAPTLASLTLDYRSREHFTVGDAQAHECFFTLGPFGYTTAGNDIPARLVPEFAGRAALYLGMKNFAPPGDLPVLFKLDEGTATVPELLKTTDITWRYLSGDRWIELPGTAVRIDETLGFQQ